MKKCKWPPFRPSENIQLQFALSYLVIIAIVLLLLNTYPLLASQSLVFQSKQSILTEAQMIASNLAELEDLREDGVEQVMSLVGDSRLTRIVVTDTDAKILYDTQKAKEKRKYALFQELIQALEGQDVFHSAFQDDAFTSMNTTANRQKSCWVSSPTCAISHCWSVCSLFWSASSSPAW